MSHTLKQTELRIKNLDQMIELLKTGKNYKEAIKHGTNNYNICQYKINKVRLEQIGQLVNLIQLNYINVQKQGEVNQQKKKYTWLANQLKLFVWMAICHSYLLNKPLQDYQQQNWIFFTDVLTRKNYNDLEFQSKSLFKNYKGNKQKWQDQQQHLLKLIIEDDQYHNKWNDISRILYFTSSKKYYRSSQKCRQYWFNHLDSRLNKNPWTIQEDIKLVDQLLLFGFKWSKLTQVIETTWGYRRTEHMVKNRTKFLCKKYGFKDQKEQGCMKELKMIQKKLRQEQTRHDVHGENVKQEESLEDRQNPEKYSDSENKIKESNNEMQNQDKKIKQEAQKDQQQKREDNNNKKKEDNNNKQKEDTHHKKEDTHHKKEDIHHKKEDNQLMQSESESQQDYNPKKKPTHHAQLEDKSTIKRNVIILYHATQPKQQYQQMLSEQDESPEIIIGRHVEEHKQSEEEEQREKEESYFDEYNIVEEVADEQIDLDDDIQFQHDTHGGKMRERVTHQLAKFFPGDNHDGQC